MVSNFIMRLLELFLLDSERETIEMSDALAMLLNKRNYIYLHEEEEETDADDRRTPDEITDTVTKWVQALRISQPVDYYDSSAGLWVDAWVTALEPEMVHAKGLQKRKTEKKGLRGRVTLRLRISEILLTPEGSVPGRHLLEKGISHLARCRIAHLPETECRLMVVQWEGSVVPVLQVKSRGAAKSDTKRRQWSILRPKMSQSSSNLEERRRGRI